jgi:hypothetical protein
MRNYRIHVACLAWLAAMIALPSDVVMLFLAGPIIFE